MKPLLSLGVCLLLCAGLMAQSLNPKVQAAVDAGVISEENQELLTSNTEAADFANFMADHVFRIFDYGKPGDASVKPASELVHIVTGAAITKADLEDFNPILFEFELDPIQPTYYAIDEQTTLMFLSKKRVEELFKRDQINRQAAAKQQGQ